MKNFTKPTVKQASMSVLISVLDRLVSDFVRMSAADERGTVQCVSCDARIYWKDADCAHYINRAKMSTRYYLPNLAPACIGCNRFNPDIHLIRWEFKMGVQRANELRKLGNALWKYTRPELLYMIEEYKVLNAALRKKF